MFEFITRLQVECGSQGLVQNSVWKIVTQTESIDLPVGSRIIVEEISFESGSLTCRGYLGASTPTITNFLLDIDNGNIVAW